MEKSVRVFKRMLQKYGYFIAVFCISIFLFSNCSKEKEDLSPKQSDLSTSQSKLKSEPVSCGCTGGSGIGPTWGPAAVGNIFNIPPENVIMYGSGESTMMNIVNALPLPIPQDSLMGMVKQIKKDYPCDYLMQVIALKGKISRYISDKRAAGSYDACAQGAVAFAAGFSMLAIPSSGCNYVYSRVSLPGYPPYIGHVSNMFYINYRGICMSYVTDVLNGGGLYPYNAATSDFHKKYGCQQFKLTPFAYSGNGCFKSRTIKGKVVIKNTTYPVGGKKVSYITLQQGRWEIYNPPTTSGCDGTFTITAQFDNWPPLELPNSTKIYVYLPDNPEVPGKTVDFDQTSALEKGWLADFVFEIPASLSNPSYTPTYPSYPGSSYPSSPSYTGH